MNGRIQGYRFRNDKKPVGAFIVAKGATVLVFRKPFFLHRWMMRICFGWKWEDAKL